MDKIITAFKVNAKKNYMAEDEKISLSQKRTDGSWECVHVLNNSWLFDYNCVLSIPVLP